MYGSLGGVPLGQGGLQGPPGPWAQHRPPPWPPGVGVVGPDGAPRGPEGGLGTLVPPWHHGPPRGGRWALKASGPHGIFAGPQGGSVDIKFPFKVPF